MKALVLLISSILLCVEGTFYYPRGGSAAPLIRLSMAKGVEAETRQSYLEWSDARSNTDITRMVNLYTDDATIFPNNRTPIQGRVGLVNFYLESVNAGTWPRNALLVQDKVLENCANKLVVTSYYGRTVRFDGTVGFTAGIRVFRRVGGVLKISQAIWKAIPESEIPPNISFTRMPRYRPPVPGHPNNRYSPSYHPGHNPHNY